MPRTILDVTRLLTRASHPVATGVDRVELAYARRALDLAPDRVGFAAIVGSRSVALSREPLGAFVAALDRKWRNGGSEASARRLAERLGAPFDPQPAALAERDEAARLALRLRAMAALSLLKSPVQPGDRYVHVSHIRLDRPEVFSRLAAAGARIVILVHDLIPIRFPEYGRAGEADRHASRMGTALDHAATLIANSRDTARDLAAFAQETGRTAPQIVVAPLGLEAGFDAAARPLQTQKPYFVALGTIEPRKNHLLLLHVWRRLAERFGADAPTLVLAGRRGWENEMVIDMLERSPAIRAHVVETNDLPDSALAALVKGAGALLFPSFAEGYGLPLAEALALGAPAIASDLPAFREIAGDRVEMLDPLDGPAWEQAVVDFAPARSPRRLSAIARAAGYVAPSWDDHFARVAEATGL
jgi:glycosyltransferase involved in cell wall biosynthesis